MAMLRRNERLALLVPASLLVLAMACGGSKGAAPGPDGLPTTAITSPLPATLPAKVDDGVILTAFEWPFASIQAQLPAIAAAGYNAVQVSPVNPTKSSATGSAFQWYLFYQPLDLIIGNAQLGSEADFTAMCAAANALGIHIIVDAVLNQTADNGTPGGLDPNVAGYIKANPSWFHQTGLTVQNWANRVDETQQCEGNGPDWNTQNAEVQSLMLGFLNQCVADGASGFRFDSAKSIETNTPIDIAAGVPTGAGPSGSVTLYQFDRTSHSLNSTAYPVKGTGNFWDDVLPNLTNRSSLFLYGEVIEQSQSDGGADNEPGYQTYLRTTGTNLIYPLAEAVLSQNLAANGAQSPDAWPQPWNDGHFQDPTQILVYAENWDQYESGLVMNTSSFSYNMRLLENAILTARAGMVNNLFARPGEGLWWDPCMVAVNRFRNAMVGTSEYLIYNGSAGAIAVPQSVMAIKRQRGSADQGMVLVNVASAAAAISLSTSLPAGTYPDLGPSGTTYTVANGTLTGTLPGNTTTVAGVVVLTLPTLQ